MNQLGDLTQTEYRALMLGAKYPGNKTKDTGSTFLPASGVKLPDTVDWRTQGYVTPVKNQGTLQPRSQDLGAVQAIE
jgi:cathepsin L